MHLTLGEIFLRIFVGFLLSGIIGLEREGINRPAGLRTHILVGTGSTLIMITGIFLAENYIETDAARLGAQVVSGIGFLGAGTIIKEGVSVRGLTTAASLWATAGIGLACGAGFLLPAVFTTAIVMFSLVFFQKINRLLINRRHEIRLNILCTNHPGQIGAIGTYLGNENVQIKQISIHDEQEESLRLKMILRLPLTATPVDIIEGLKTVDGIKEIDS